MWQLDKCRQQQKGEHDRQRHQWQSFRCWTHSHFPWSRHHYKHYAWVLTMVRRYEVQNMWGWMGASFQLQIKEGKKGGDFLSTNWRRKKNEQLVLFPPNVKESSQTSPCERKKKKMLYSYPSVIAKLISDIKHWLRRSKRWCIFWKRGPTCTIITHSS